MTAFAQNLRDERVWTGINGKTFRGTYQSLLDGGKNVQFYTVQGKPLVIAIENLAEWDRKLILGTPAAGKNAPAAVGDVSAFKPPVSPDRTSITSMSSKGVSSDNGASMVDALWIGMMWWDQIGALPVPQKGDFDRKAEWLHKKLTRVVAAPGNKTTSLEDAQKGVGEYLESELKDMGTCRNTLEKNNLTPARISGMVTEDAIAVIRFSMVYENGNSYNACAALESMTPEGKFAFHFYGKRFTGTLGPAGADAEESQGGYEFFVDQRNELPAYQVQNNPRFYLGKKNWHGLLLLRPYIYATPGKPAPLPPDTAPASPDGESDGSHEVVRHFNPDFPMNFSSMVALNREWNFKDGRKFTGAPINRPGKLPAFKGASGEIEIEESQLLPEDRALYYFWQATCGNPAATPRLDLTYRFTTSRKGSFEINIATEGTLGRVSCPMNGSVLVYDLKDGAFQVTRTPVNNEQGKVRIYWGRFHPDHLMPRTIGTFFPQEDLNRLAKITMPASSPSRSVPFPARLLGYPLKSPTSTFRDPQFDFVLADQDTVLAGIYQFLNMQTSGPDGGVFMFSNDAVPWNTGCKHVFPLLAAGHILPIRIRWNNALQENIPDPERREVHAGPFSLELIRATVPDSFQEGHCSIIPEARTAPVGITLKNFE